MQRTDPKYTDAVRFLLDRINYEKTTDTPYNQRSYRLARMSFLLECLDAPHLAAPVIHIAGTKGKGSVAWLVAETLRRSGRTTGLYTSPHLEFLEERFVINGLPVTPEQLLSVFGDIRTAANLCSDSEHGPPTFFELTTAMAWKLFSAAKTDVNVIEVGLGGRLDSTNVCNPEIAIITSISYDHQQQLGETLAEIAGEKAGIIKDHIPVIHGAQVPEARDVIRSVANSRHARLWEIERDFRGRCMPVPRRAADQNDPTRAPGTPFTFEAFPPLPAFEQSPMHLRMLGKHQADNAAIACATWLALNEKGWEIPRASLEDALADTQVPARIEWLSSRPVVIVDSAHNEASIAALIDTLSSSFDTPRKTVILACSRDKKYAAMVEQLLGYADRLIVTQYRSNPRFVPVEKLEAMARDLIHRTHRQVEILSAPDVPLALEYAKDTAQPDELICITGSFFTAAEARAKLGQQ